MIKYIIYSAIALTFMMSCSPKHGNSSDSHQTVDYTLASLEEVDPCLIPLDSITSQDIKYLQLINDSTLAFMNIPSFNICIVNLRDKSTSKIQLHKEGPDAIAYVDAFCYVNPDSIWIYESWGKKLTLVGSDGVIKQKIKIPENDRSGQPLEYAVYPLPQSATPYIVHGTRHILNGMTTAIAEGQKRGVTLIYDEGSDSVSTGNPYPAVYGKPDDFDKWNLMGYRLSKYTVMPDGRLLTSFPASDSLYVYNPDDKTSTAYFAGHNGNTGISMDSSAEYEDGMRSYVAQYSYGGVVRDMSGEAYFRFLRYPPSDNLDMENLQECFSKKPTGIIILDADLNVVGEYTLPEDRYYTGHSFANSDGLHVKVESEDDDFLKFRVFKLKR